VAHWDEFVAWSEGSGTLVPCLITGNQAVTESTVTPISQRLVPTSATWLLHWH
jgi:hypothetical protein